MSKTTPAPPADTTTAADLLQAAKVAADTLNGTHGKQRRQRVREALLQAIAKATGAAAAAAAARALEDGKTLDDFLIDQA